MKLKNLKKSIAITLTAIMLGIPLMRTTYALDKNNYTSQQKIQDEQSNNPQERIIFAIPAIAIAPSVFAALGITAATGLTIYDIYRVSKSTANEIDNAWKKIPQKLKDADGTVGIGKFDKKLKNGVRESSKTGWKIDPDRAGHKGSKWKLKDKKGNRVASLDSEGRVVGK
ncbi:hypothetical protein MWV98_001387 [Clostridioides difficile]|nr:hypothetical protein [Clostridioides difficile]